jgi:hypothetical protein
MDELKDLFLKKYYFEDRLYEKYYRMTGWIKKKNDKKALRTVFKQSKKKFFCFHLRGRLLCYYEQEPVSGGRE